MSPQLTWLIVFLILGSDKSCPLLRHHADVVFGGALFALVYSCCIVQVSQGRLLANLIAHQVLANTHASLGSDTSCPLLSHQVVTAAAAYESAVLYGLDMRVFTAGIGGMVQV